MTAPLADVDLEELFAERLPCGGNHFPVDRPCPHDAEATMVCVHICQLDPQAYKCDYCHKTWLDAVVAIPGDIVCEYCDWSAPPGDLYRHL